VGKLHQIGDRESQQDCLAVSPEALYESKGILAVVADGMGGLADGDKVSQTVAGTMMNSFMMNREASPELILALTAEANQAVNRFLGANQGRSGSTLVAGIVKDGLFNYVSVGDSRICLYRQGLLSQLNREHIYRNELRTQAVNGFGTLWDASTHPKAAGLTSYLGMGELKYVDIPAEPLRVCADDKIILMSDGVYNAMTLPELEAALALPAQQAADTIAATIHSKAFRHQDNYTAVILQF
jgi:serine/threonine protein phosphatase PrpC